ncbi:alanine acetyltransferase [Loktanella sp. 5RATIMAR09]|uniref:GNAT family N-acetyltransferase n=1 Tax=Loktanella sp. 5RATIMAR09 TaxID=1225655 RepID=UPI0006EB3A40|nr:GNAT family N-acetyltransferase [Loktanella sp. 5RATIMAR09]KQI72350.1 alanine acetyltransferase [Loktanella sp. 5RATIMAR09]
MTPSELATLHAAAFSATRAWSADEFADLLKHPGTFVIGDAHSFALIRTVLDEAELLTIATAPTMRRQGLARAALTAGERRAQTEGAVTLFLEVAEDNDPAIALYTASGYRQIGRRPGYYLPKDGAPLAALVLRKSLTVI